jgi:hypothetical protein
MSKARAAAEDVDADEKRTWTTAIQIQEPVTVARTKR